MLGVVHIYLPYFADMDGIRMLAAKSEGESDKTFDRPRSPGTTDETRSSNTYSRGNAGGTAKGG